MALESRPTQAIVLERDGVSTSEQILPDAKRLPFRAGGTQLSEDLSEVRSSDRGGASEMGKGAFAAPTTDRDTLLEPILKIHYLEAVLEDLRKLAPHAGTLHGAYFVNRVIRSLRAFISSVPFEPSTTFALALLMPWPQGTAGLTTASNRSNKPRNSCGRWLNHR